MSLINKMLLDLDQQVEGERHKTKSKPISILDGLRPAEAGRDVASLKAPQRYRYALLGLLLMVLPASVWWWQTMRPPLDHVQVIQAVQATVPVLSDNVVAEKPTIEILAVATKLPSNNDIDGGIMAQPPPSVATTTLPLVDSKPLPVEQIAPPLKTIKSLPLKAKPRAKNDQPVQLSKDQQPVSVPLVMTAQIDEVEQPATLSKEVMADSYREAILFQEQSQLPEAIKKYHEALAQDARHIKARERLTDLLMKQGQLLEAQDLLYEGINLIPEHVLFSQQLARLYIEQGNDEKALSVLENSRELAQSEADFLGLLAATYQRLGRFTQAREAYTQALELLPLEGTWWAGLAIAYEAEKNWSAARDAYNRVRASLNVDPKLIAYAERRLITLADKQ